MALVCPPLVALSAEEPTAGDMRVGYVIQMQNGVTAQWESDRGKEEPALGKEGNIKWTCELAPEERVTLSLEYKVSAPAGVTLAGI